MNSKSLNPFASDPFNTMAEPVEEKVSQAVESLETEPAPAPVKPKAKAKPAARRKAPREKAKHSLSLSDHCWKQLRFNSFLEGRSASDIIEELVSNHLAEVRVTRKAG